MAGSCIGFKEIVSRDEYFFKVKSDLSVNAPLDFNIFWRLANEKSKINVFARFYEITY